MPLNKSQGNMYEWASHTHSHLRGQCPHGCAYCYVQAHERRWHTGAFAGPLRFNEEELTVNYGRGRVIFIEHQNDLFADDVPPNWISDILAHCCRYPGNVYVFQSKNPRRMLNGEWKFPAIRFMGTTIESDMSHPAMGKAPPPDQRFVAGLDFVTIEPVMKFSESFGWKVARLRPRWVNIGADSKGNNLREPGQTELLELVHTLMNCSVPVHRKTNLARLLGEPR